MMPPSGFHPASRLSTRVPRTSFWRSAWREYQSDLGVKLPLEFAAVGCVALLFVSLPGNGVLPWMIGSAPGSIASTPAAGGAAAPMPGAGVTGPAPVVQAGSSAAGGTRSLTAPDPPPLPVLDAVMPVAPTAFSTPFDHTLLASSGPQARPVLERAADLLSQSRPDAAQRALGELDQADPNTLLLTGLARLGLNQPGSVTEAITLLKRADAAGQQQAAVFLGVIHVMPFMGLPEKIPEGVRWLERADASGRGDASRLLGEIYARGLSGSVDLTRAATYFARGDEFGDGEAAANLAAMYLRGQGMNKDLAKAEELLRRAVARGSTGGLYGLGTLLQIRYLTGLSVDENEIITYLQRSIDGGNDTGAVPLGWFLAEGIRDPAKRQPERGLGTLAACAARRHADCIFAYAYMLQRGIGTAPDPVKAYAHYLAVASVMPRSAARMAELDPLLTDVQRNEARAMAVYIQAGGRQLAAPPQR